MKHRKRRRSASGAQRAFVRGFVATALLATIEAGRTGETQPVRGVVRQALKAAIAVAAGTAAASGLEERRPAAALAAVLGGGVLLAVTQTTVPDERNRGVL